MVGDFNAPDFDWKSGLSLLNSSYYSKLKGDSIYISKCFPNLNECTDTIGSTNLLELIFSNLSHLCITPVDPGLLILLITRLSIFIYPLPIVFRITYISTVNSLLGNYIHCFPICSQLETGFLCMVPPLSILLSSASVLLFKMPWNRQFLRVNRRLLAAEDGVGSQVISYEDFGGWNDTEAVFCPSLLTNIPLLLHTQLALPFEESDGLD